MSDAETVRLDAERGSPNWNDPSPDTGHSAELATALTPVKPEGGASNHGPGCLDPKRSQSQAIGGRCSHRRQGKNPAWRDWQCLDCGARPVDPPLQIVGQSDA